jgi:hypothetical protein
MRGVILITGAVTLAVGLGMLVAGVVVLTARPQRAATVLLDLCRTQGAENRSVAEQDCSVIYETEDRRFVTHRAHFAADAVVPRIGAPATIDESLPEYASPSHARRRTVAVALVACGGVLTVLGLLVVYFGVRVYR